MRIAAYSHDETMLRALFMKLGSYGEGLQPIEDLDDLSSWDVAADVVVVSAEAGNLSSDELRRRIKDCRQEGFALPVLVVVDDAERAHELLDAGVDDVALHSVKPLELQARIRAIHRRSQSIAQSLIEFGDMVFDFNTQTLSFDEDRIALTGTEARIFEKLALNVDRTVSKGAIWDELYPTGEGAEIKIVDVLICKIRKKIEAAGGNPGHIVTMWGKGYALTRSPDGTVRAPGSGATEAILSTFYKEGEMLHITELHRKVAHIPRYTTQGIANRLVREGHLEIATRQPTTAYRITQSGKLKYEGMNA